MWLALDGIAAAASYKQGGNYLLPAGYTAGCIITLAVTAYTRRFAFAKSDIWVFVLVFICATVWLTSSGDATIIASALAVLIAGFPLMILYWRDPRQGSPLVWIIFTGANLCGLIGHQGWGLDQWFFPVCALTGSISTLVLIIRR
jgi:hypothetical protein